MKWLPTLVMMSLSVMLGSIPSSGQATTGIGGSIQHLGYDSIDLSSLRVTVDVPLRAGRGPAVSDALEIDQNFDIYLGSNLQGPKWFLGYQNEGTWKVMSPHGGTFYWGASTTVQCLSGTTYYSRLKQTNPYILDSMGIQHPLPLSWYYYGAPIGNCQNSSQYPYSGMTTDGSSIWGGPTITSVDKSGFSNLGAVDPDGNDVNAFHPGTAYATQAGNNVTYVDASGNTQTVSIATSSSTITSNWNCPGIADENQTGFLLPTSVSYADGTSLGISYEPGPNGGTTGRLQTLTLPTGGTVTYFYTGGNAPGPGVGKVCSTTGLSSYSYGLTRATSAGTWTYNATAYLSTTYPYYGYGSVTTVTDPSGNNSILTFNGSAEVMSQSYQGGGVNCANGCTNTNLLRTTYYCYNNWTPTQSGDTGTLPTACGNIYEPAPNYLNSVPIEKDVYTAIPGVSGYTEIATSYIIEDCII